MSLTVYIIEMPNTPAREITNINFNIVAPKIEALGGKIYPKPNVQTKPYIPPVLPKSDYSHTDKPTYTWSEVLVIADNIKRKYFSHCKEVMSIPVRLGRRTTRRLGSCRMRRDFSVYRGKVAVDVVLSKELVNGRSTDKLEQVIYHEFLHVEYPNQGHFGKNFRYKETNNPFRTKRTRRLTCVS